MRAFHEHAARARATQTTWANINLVDVATGKQVINLRRPFGAPLPEIRMENPTLMELAKSGRPFVTAVSKGPVILDMGLPKPSGWEVFLTMKKNQPEVRVILASGYVKPEIRSEMLRQGVLEIVPKPYLPDELVAKLGVVISEPPPLQLT